MTPPLSKNAATSGPSSASTATLSRYWGCSSARAKQYLISGEVKPGAFVSRDGAEARLWGAFTQRHDRLARALEHHQYRDSFAVLAELGPDVAAFFDRGGVMVMDPDPALRENRLSLLSRIYEPFARIADFRQLGGAA